MRTTSETGPVQNSIDRLRGEVERLFEMAYQRGGKALDVAGVRPPFMAEFPPTDIIETHDAVHVVASLPGVSAELLDVNVTGQFLRIRGSVAGSAHSQSGTFHRRERREGAFKRAYPLPCTVDVNAAKATLAEGILTIRLSKAVEEVGHKIVVNEIPVSESHSEPGPPTMP